MEKKPSAWLETNPRIVQNLVETASSLAYFLQHHTKPKSNAHFFVISFLEPGMARKANFRPSKKHDRAEFWLDVELLDPNFASLVCRYIHACVSECDRNVLEYSGGGFTS